MFKSLSRTVTCTRELISIHMCYSQGDGLNTPLSRLSYLVLYTVLQLSTCLCSLSLYGTKYPMYWTLMMNVIQITSTSTSPAPTSTRTWTVHPWPNVRAPGLWNTQHISRSGTRGICEMVSDGGGRFIPAYIVGAKHIIFITFGPGSR